MMALGVRISSNVMAVLALLTNSYSLGMPRMHATTPCQDHHARTYMLGPPC